MRHNAAVLVFSHAKSAVDCAEQVGLLRKQTTTKDAALHAA